MAHKCQVRTWNTRGMSDTSIAEKVPGNDTVREAVAILASRGVLLIQERKLFSGNVTKFKTHHQKNWGCVCGAN